ncbi:MAG: adenylate/guanylate cyclase domain-containing protein [Leptospiraceae bacterium]|nr:adenylate/guanylate cyclase domain-containing protein [Leptospiraceae bacterium]
MQSDFIQFDSVALDQSARRLKERPNADTGAVDAIMNSIETWLGRADYPALSRINPYAVQQLSGIPVDRLVPEFLQGVHAGVFDLHWDVHCPHCNMITQEFGSLADGIGHSHCEMCAVDFDVDFIQRVEVSFSPIKDILDIRIPPMCEVPAALSPQYLIKGLMPAEQRSAEVELTEGSYRYFCPLTRSIGTMIVSGTISADVQAVTIRQMHRTFDRQNIQARPGRVRFTVQNNSGDISGLVLAENKVAPALCVTDLAPRLTGLDLTHYPVFHQLFGHQVPSEREQLRIEAVTILFTDIAGSTRMYEDLGDAAAYNIVRDHFDILIQEIEKHGGVVIKTIGDSIMASFTGNTGAMDAILATRERFAQYNQNQPEARQVRIRVGMHRGPAILVNLNGRLDYFGSSVNRAARLEALSRSQELTFSSDILEDRRVRNLLALRGQRAIRKRKVMLKGIDEAQPVYSLSIA